MRSNADGLRGVCAAEATQVGREKRQTILGEMFSIGKDCGGLEEVVHGTLLQAGGNSILQQSNAGR